MKSRAGTHLPVHRRHKTHNRGYIHCEGRQWWTAEWVSMAANHLYDIFVSLWLQAGRRLPDGLNPKEWQARKQAALANMDSESEAQEVYSRVTLSPSAGYKITVNRRAFDNE